MERIRTLVTILSVAFGFSLINDMFGLKVYEGVNVLIEMIFVVCLLWLLFIVNKKENRKQNEIEKPTE